MKGHHPDVFCAAILNAQRQYNLHDDCVIQAALESPARSVASLGEKVVLAFDQEAEQLHGAQNDVTLF
jgi:hypothetical protein